jgi:hypothetical protein
MFFICLYTTGCDRSSTARPAKSYIRKAATAATHPQQPTAMRKNVMAATQPHQPTAMRKDVMAATQPHQSKATRKDATAAAQPHQKETKMVKMAKKALTRAVVTGWAESSDSSCDSMMVH